MCPVHLAQQRELLRAAIRKLISVRGRLLLAHRIGIAGGARKMLRHLFSSPPVHASSRHAAGSVALCDIMRK